MNFIQPFGTNGTQYKRKALLVIVFLIAELLLLATSAAKITFAAPPYTYSYYMTTNDSYRAYILGCGQGTTDRNSGQNRDDVMIVDYGAQYYNGSWGAFYPRTTTRISDADIQATALQIATRYYQCLANANSSHIILAIGTNNSGSQTNYTGGQHWSQLVVNIQNDINNHGLGGYVTIYGGNDMELIYSLPGDAINWIKGYISISTRPYYDFGDATGCPPAGSCNNTWTQSNVYYVAWGASSPYSFVIPEIYNTAHVNSAQ